MLVIEDPMAILQRCIVENNNAAYRSGLYSTLFEFLECGCRSFRGVDELEVGVRAVNALRVRRHDGRSLGWRCKERYAQHSIDPVYTGCHSVPVRNSKAIVGN